MIECLGIYDEFKVSCRNPPGVIGRVYWDEMSDFFYYGETPRLEVEND